MAGGPRRGLLSISFVPRQVGIASTRFGRCRPGRIRGAAAGTNGRATPVAASGSYSAAADACRSLRATGGLDVEAMRRAQGLSPRRNAVGPVIAIGPLPDTAVRACGRRCVRLDPQRARSVKPSRLRSIR
jgi:hypothetical protein